MLILVGCKTHNDNIRNSISAFEGYLRAKSVAEEWTKDSKLLTLPIRDFSENSRAFPAKPS